MRNKEERLDILEQLEKGKLSPEDAARLLEEDPETLLNELEHPMDVLEALEGGKISTEQAAAKLGNGPRREQEHSSDFSNIEFSENEQEPRSGIIWMILSSVGVLTIALSAWWMASRISGPGGMDFWFFVAWIPFLIGLLLLVIGWMSRNAPWIRIRVRSKHDGSSFRLNLGFPIPTGIIRWGIGTSNRFEHKIDMLEIDKILESFEKGNLAEPITIHVDDEDDDVEIIIG